MIVYAIYVFRVKERGSAFLRLTAYELSSLSFFQRGTAKEVLLFGNRQVASLAAPGSREVVKIGDGSYLCHAYHGGCTAARGPLVATCTTDGEYPQRVAFSMLAKVLEAYGRARPADNAADADAADAELPEISEILRAYQDPAKADPVARMQKDLDETKQVLVKTIDQMLERGRTLDQLVDSSQDLSFQSRAFLHQAEKANSCCSIL
eukprot:m51a1_g1774 Synaptobrevin homologue Ykt6 A (207) ;mRNA; r:322475-323289